jgi:release factor glutamine methyltransferase
VTIGDALARAGTELRDVSHPRRTAETLLMYVLGCEQPYLHAHPERELTSEEQSRFDMAVTRRVRGEPLQYITGHQQFWGLDFKVTPAVLIPRPETEHLVEAALELIDEAAARRLRAVDVGTGSGCIILALAHEVQKRDVFAELHAVDMSEAALSVARENAKRLDLADIVQFRLGDVLTPFIDQAQSFDLVLSNPPYVGRSEWEKVQREVREHEPEAAVFAGEHGLDIYRRLIPQARQVLKPSGWLLLEIGYSIEQPVRDLLSEWSEVRTVPDLQGIPRVVLAEK